MPGTAWMSRVGRSGREEGAEFGQRGSSTNSVTWGSAGDERVQVVQDVCLSSVGQRAVAALRSVGQCVDRV